MGFNRIWAEEARIRSFSVVPAQVEPQGPAAAPPSASQPSASSSSTDPPPQPPGDSALSVPAVLPGLPEPMRVDDAQARLGMERQE